MEDIAADLAKDIYDRLQNLSPSQRLLIGVAGIPASGKTTLAHLAVKHLNSLWLSENQPTDPVAIAVGLDGWHLTREQLSVMPDAKLAFDRRGIHWTFDPISYLSFVRLLKVPVNPASPVIKAPSFDHALKDPTPDAIHILPTNKVIIIEGLYVLLNTEGWKEAAELLDERWFVDTEVPEARKRLIRRHVVTGVASDEKEAIWRADENDMPNGVFLLANMVPPTKRIRSVEVLKFLP